MARRANRRAHAMTGTPAGPPLPGKLTHGGGVVWRSDEAGTRVLMVRATPPPHDWVFPKGHIEQGETVQETARREVREEAGVDATPGPYLGLLEFDSPRGEHVRAAYFLMRFVREVERDEQRELRWWPVDEALKMCRFEDSRALIRAAVDALERLAKCL
jgi:8-oxo-dGTP pyrophosphatase MutT (NUDIX family)